MQMKLTMDILPTPLAAPTWALVLVMLTITSLLLLVLVRKKHTQSHAKPPSPPKIPIIGNLHQLGTLPHQSLAKLADKYGPVMLLQLGYEPTLIISSAAAAKDALKTYDADFCSRPRVYSGRKLSYNCRDMVFAPYSDYWRQIRKTLTLELFSLKHVQSFQPVRDEEINAMIESIAFSATKVEVVDISKLMFASTAGITFKVAFGKSFEGSMMDGHGFEELLHEIFGMLGSFMAADYLPYIGWIFDKFCGLHTRLDNVFKKLDAFFQDLIDEHKNPERVKNDTEDIVDVLLRIQREHIQLGKTWFTEKNIKAVLFDVFIGGVDTGALTVTWALTELVKNREVMKKLQEEIRRSMAGKGKVTQSDVENLSYFKLVLKEVMRLHPIVPLLVPRQTIVNTQILGYPVQAKTRVYVNVWAIGRDPKIWHKPEMFSPERFVGSHVDYKGQHYELLPFGAGRRICPGMNFGMATVELALANLLYSFDWKLPDGMTAEDICTEEGAGLTTFKKTPLKLVPVKYQS